MSRTNGTNGTSKTNCCAYKLSKTVGQMGQMEQMEHKKLSLHTAISGKKSCFIVRNLSEIAGQMGQMGDKWDVHLSRQSGGQMVCGSIDTHHMSFCPRLLGIVCKKSVRREKWQQGT